MVTLFTVDLLELESRRSETTKVLQAGCCLVQVFLPVKVADADSSSDLTGVGRSFDYGKEQTRGHVSFGKS